jgi:hypothetical protein
MELIMDDKIAQSMIRDMSEGLQKLRLPDVLPSEKAVEIFVEMIARKKS